MFTYRDHIGWSTSKIISPPNSDKIVRWRFLRNRQLILRLHTIFRALIYWAHRAVIFAVAWLLVKNCIWHLAVFWLSVVIWQCYEVFSCDLMVCRLLQEPENAERAEEQEDLINRLLYSDLLLK